MRRAVVILGASGRLGRQLVPLFTSAGFAVIAVARTPSATEGSENERLISADVTIDEDRARVAATVDAWTTGTGYVCLVDAVLDRSGVDAMRRSVQGFTELVWGLRDRLSTGGRVGALFAASTTAVLAPGLYQTPYGLVKRRQLIAYARSGVPGMALLLPVLAAPVTPAARRPLWSFERAAHRLVAAACEAPPIRSGFTIHVPGLATAEAAATTTVLSAAGTAVAAHLRCLVIDRDSMQAHREAARLRLLLAPSQGRLRVDHHLAPPALVRRFANRYHVSLWDERTAEVPQTGIEAADA